MYNADAVSSAAIGIIPPSYARSAPTVTIAVVRGEKADVHVIHPRTKRAYVPDFDVAAGVLRQYAPPARAVAALERPLLPRMAAPDDILRLGHVYGALYGMLAALDIPFRAFPKRQWHEHALQLLGGQALRVDDYLRLRHPHIWEALGVTHQADDRPYAILLALYARAMATMRGSPALDSARA